MNTSLEIRRRSGKGASIILRVSLGRGMQWRFATGYSVKRLEHWDGSIQKVRDASGNEVRFAFVDGRICCAIPVNRNLFEPRVWKSGVNMEDVALMERMIALNSELIESLDLNTRIWTKE